MPGDQSLSTDDTMRRRLEALNRGPLPATVRRSIQTAAPPANRPATRAQTKSTETKSDFTSSRPTPGLLHSGDVVETLVGQHIRIRLSVDAFWQNGGQLIAARQDYLTSSLASASQAIEPAVIISPEFASLVKALPDRTVALDLETCGLAGCALFLVGLFRHIAGQPTVELLLARNYAEEAAVLNTLWETLANYDVLLTFNGKTFDWPMVLERSVRHRLQNHKPLAQFTHIDILHHARRRWRKQLPNCKLQTLEWHVCRRRRAADIPGSQIPAVYANYVRTGFERDMDTVLHHNALDLVTLFDLALRLAA
jgi:uncharacterized protein YprB with RNaseH-like and TPR domain